jgi:hypothetical protein
MFQRRIPEWMRHAPTPGVRGFAVLGGLESMARGILTSVFPVEMYRVFQSAEKVSEVYFAIGVASLFAALSTPWLSRTVPRFWLYSLAAGAMISGGLAGASGADAMIPVALVASTIATVVMQVCFSAYVMDYIARASLGQCETSRLFYSAAGWTLGPYLGILLLDIWHPAPFLISAASAATLLGVFWFLRLGNGKEIRRTTGPATSPLAYLPRFLKQPRLVTGWTIAVVRSCGWWVYCVYLPIYAVEQGYSGQLGGLALSVTNGFLFTTPLILRAMHRYTIRTLIISGFCGSAVGFALATGLSGIPPLALLCLFAGSFCMIVLDVAGGLPFLMAVRPSERTEMSAVYSTFRDVSGVVTPGVARLVLAVAPLPFVFAAAAAALAATAGLATRLNPRLGAKGLKPPQPAVGSRHAQQA